ncbi:MAG: magnesium transporter [Candidatus Aenigmarchaeota archaeon]|nr:magnesium transporter [Candidatus Aenigmarchaeota archaeon]
MKLSSKLRKQLARLKRHEHNPLIHKIHRKHKISHRTIFYMKEYGPKSNIVSVILRESLLALILAFLFSTISGISLQKIQSSFIAFLPLIILLPALNDMIGDYSMIMVSRLSTLVFTKGTKRDWWMDEDIRKLIRTIALVAIFSAFYISAISSLIAYLNGFSLTLASVLKVLQISLFTTLSMVSLIIVIAAFAVYYVYSRKEDPNNLVLPVMTSIADLGTILIFAVFIKLIF